MVKIYNEIVYEQNKQLTTDLYLPTKKKSNSKALLFWHGGGWFRGDKSNLKELCVQSAEAGFTVFAPNYSLAPSAIFPAAHQDCLSFVNWLFDHHDGQKFTSIKQIGASSGGSMALFLAGKFGFPTVTWSAPVSFSSWLKDHPQVKPSPQANIDFGLTDIKQINDSFYKYFTLTYVGSSNEQALRKLDAQSYDYQKLDRLLMINSTDELAPVKYLLDFIAELARQNHAVDLKLIAGKRHAMAYAQALLDTSLNYLDK